MKKIMELMTLIIAELVKRADKACQLYGADEIITAGNRGELPIM